MTKRILISLIIIIIGSVFLLTFKTTSKTNTDISINNTPILETNNKEVFVTKTECESKTGKTCSFQRCDYIPEGVTYEEACGKDFKKGWVSTSK